MNEMIFVFGSNRAGIHGAGAAKWALENCGAVWGKGEGLQYSCYAIPTKDVNIQTLPLTEIAKHFETFINFAKDRPHLLFDLTPIGCGLAGYNKTDMLHEVVLRQKIPDNVYFNRRWMQE